MKEVKEFLGCWEKRKKESIEGGRGGENGVLGAIRRIQREFLIIHHQQDLRLEK